MARKVDSLGDILNGLFAVKRRKILRHSTILNGNQCSLNKYTVAIISLLSRDISL